MTVWSAADVDAAVADGSRTVQVGARDVVTPLARERARDLGVTFQHTQPPSALAARAERSSTGPTESRGARRPGPAARAERSSSGGARAERSSSGREGLDGPPAPVRPPSGALFRRGAPLPGGLASAPGRPGRPGSTSSTGRTGRVVVVGAGHVGMITAMRLAEADVFDEVVLVDIDSGRAAGVALDLTHTAPLAGFATRVRGVGTVEGAGSCDYAVITAGRSRQPGMSRSDLIGTNAAIVGDVAATLAATSPHVVLVVVTNPLDEMTHHAWQASGLPASRVVGMAGVLDTARFQALASLTGAARADRIDAVALGSHGEEMVVPLSQATKRTAARGHRGRAGRDRGPDPRLRRRGRRAAVVRERVPGARHVRGPDGAGDGRGFR